MASSSSTPSSSSSSSSASFPSADCTPDSVSFVYPATSSPYFAEKPCRPLRNITPASAPQNKRKRDPLDADAHASGEMSHFRVVVHQPLVAAAPGSSFGPSGKLKAKPPKPYSSGEDLLSALQTTCIEDSEVDFSGSYLVAEGDADTISDKQRVQMVTHDIWKATGYRFTVKDHPPTERGHKTRLWCSQDEARRSKYRGAGDVPRLSKAGELFAKQRFACRSRLMITCLPEGPRGARIVTVRMHHYLRHEAYVEAEAASPITGATVPTIPQSQLAPHTTSQFQTVLNAPLPPHLARRDSLLPTPPPPSLHEQVRLWHAVHPPPDPVADPSLSPQFAAPPARGPPQTPSPTSHFVPAPSPVQPPIPIIDPQLELQHQHQHQHPPHPFSQPPPPPHAHTHAPPQNPPQMTPEEFQQRMHMHISRIRDFAMGLEYQVQFNDFRMLEALERDAAPFLAMVADCLRREGRIA
ncbi:hypothetical protein GGX14DRAFT_434103 [Mycena pura]|uniref:Uncharacterized protein n=1 Tax=Mycena pura TaxID=153505 RepID=A0AAD6YJW1_9AGAR|nr:hypothetical protein GGX14DRAFT_434103 [Mycena pura]